MAFFSRLAKFWLVLAIVIMGAYFTLSNQDRISLSLPPWIPHVTVPAYLVFLAFFAAGASVMAIYLGIEVLSKTIEIHKLRRQLRDIGRLDDEIFRRSESAQSLADDTLGGR